MSQKKWRPSQNEISILALGHYNQHPQKFKPSDTEWTVYAAFLASDSTEKLWVVSSATGTKCTASRNNGRILHDCHAEILAKRGLQHVLWLELLERLHGTKCDNETNLLQCMDDSSFKLKEGLQIHLFVSDSPCGDASIYDIIGDSAPQFTGSKLIARDDEKLKPGIDQIQSVSNIAVLRESVQELGQLRFKSGRSNLESSNRSTSLSCSDKILRWSVLGLQGQLLSRWITRPIIISTVVVGTDPRANQSAQLRALQRAIVMRKNAFEPSASDTSLHVSLEVFPQGKSAMEMSKRGDNGEPLSKCSKKTLAPSGISYNWQHRQGFEAIVGTRGLRQGKKPKCDEDYTKLQSRLSRASLSALAAKCAAPTTNSYHKYKQEETTWYEGRKLKLLGADRLKDWIRNSNDSGFVVARSR